MIEMNRTIKIAALSLAGIFAAASCQKTPELVLTDVGPEMNVNSWTESTYMGADIKFSVDVNDADFALSTLKAKLFYAEDAVSDVTIRTKENGTYEGTIHAPLMKNVYNGIASLVFASQNVGMGLTYDTVYVSLKRPDFDELTLELEDGGQVKLAKVANDTPEKEDDYKYEASGNFPGKMRGLLVTPAINTEGDVVKMGWQNGALSASSTVPVTFNAGSDGKYTITADLWELSVAPVDGAAAVTAVAHYQQGQVVTFPGMVDLNNWTLDYDYFVVNDDFTEVKFRAVDGYYQFSYDSEKMWIKVEPVTTEGELLSLSADGSGAPWVIGANIGKPVIGPGWNTEDGAYPMAQVADKVYQFTLTVPGQLSVSGADFKFFHQKGWGGEFTKDSYADIAIDPAFEMTDSGNIKGKALEGGKSYKLVLDLTGGVNAAKVSYDEVEVPVNMLDIKVNGVNAMKMSNTVYKVMAVEVAQNSIISFSGIDNPLGWYVDPDHFSITADGLKFNAVSGYYSFELDLANQFVTVRRVKADGSAAIYADERAITIMGWGIAHPVMTNQLAWDSGQLVTLAEVEPGVYKFTGAAVEETDGTTIGGRWRYDYISMKFFGQAGWGAEQASDLNLTDEAKKYIKQSAGSNIEMADGVTLELGATYVMTVTDCTALDGDNKFNCTVDFRKM